MSMPVIIFANIALATFIAAIVAWVMLIPLRLEHPRRRRTSSRGVATPRAPARLTTNGRGAGPAWRPVREGS